MSTVGLKLGSLVIRTLSKPIANAIKDRARDHPHFRKLCISLAQSIHRAEMRLRLNILRDAAAIERHEAAEKAAHAAPKPSSSTSSTSSAGPGSLTDTAATVPKTEGHLVSAPASDSTHTSTTQKYRIRPLSEAKAIERGATFISEFFIFTVAGSLILVESLRSRRKETARRDIIAERLELLEERSTQDEARIKVLEEEVWGLKGGNPEELKIVEPSPLWEGLEKKPGFFGGLWGKITGKKQAKADEILSSAERSTIPLSPSIPANTIPPPSLTSRITSWNIFSQKPPLPLPSTISSPPQSQSKQ